MILRRKKKSNEHFRYSALYSINTDVACIVVFFGGNLIINCLTHDHSIQKSLRQPNAVEQKVMKTNYTLCLINQM